MTAARQLGSSGSNPMGQQWEMWRVDFSFVSSQDRENSMQRLALQMFSTQYRHHTEKSLWTHIYLLESPWNPWAHTPSVTSSSVSGARVVTSVLCLLPVTQHPAWGQGMRTLSPQCFEHLYLQKKIKLFLKHKRSPYLETTRTTNYQRGSVHFFKWSREFYDVSWFPLQRFSSQKVTVRVKMIITQKTS